MARVVEWKTPYGVETVTVADDAATPKAPATAGGGPVRMLEQRKDPSSVSDVAIPKCAPEPEFFPFDTDVYERRIGLAVGPLKEMGAAWLTKRIQEAWPELDREGHVELDDTDATVFADALRIQTEDGNVIRIVRIPRFDPGSPPDYAVLAHETFHLVCGTLKDLGVPHDDREEAHAYLFEYVYRVFLGFLFGRKHETP